MQSLFLISQFIINSLRKIRLSLTFLGGWQSLCTLFWHISLTYSRPDHRGLTQYGEIFNFWLHHWVLLVIPIYVLITEHYKIHKNWFYFFLIAILAGTSFHFGPMNLAAISTGHNVSYMLHPPSSNNN